MIQGKEMSLNFGVIALLSWLKVFPFDFNPTTRKISVAISPIRRVAHALWLYFAFLHSFYLINCLIESLESFWNTKESYNIPFTFISFLTSVIAPTWNWKLFIVCPKLQANIFNGFSFNQQGWLHQNILFYCTGFQVSTSTGRCRLSSQSSQGTIIGSTHGVKVTSGERRKGEDALRKVLLRYLPVCFFPLLLTPSIAYFMLPQVPFSWINLVPEDSRTFLATTVCVSLDTLIVFFWIATGYYFCLLTLSFLDSFNEEIEQLTNKLRRPDVSIHALGEVTGTLRILRLKLQRFGHVTSYVTFTCKLLNLFLTMFCLHISLRFLDTNAGVSLTSFLLGMLSASLYATVDKTLLMPLKMEGVKKRIVILSRLHNKLTQKEIKVVVRAISSHELPVGQFFQFRRHSTPSYLSCIAMQVIHLQSAL